MLRLVAVLIVIVGIVVMFLAGFVRVPHAEIIAGGLILIGWLLIAIGLYNNSRRRKA
jgi:uncharacterized membrane protein